MWVCWCMCVCVRYACPFIDKLNSCVCVFVSLRRTHQNTTHKCHIIYVCHLIYLYMCVCECVLWRWLFELLWSKCCCRHALSSNYGPVYWIITTTTTHQTTNAHHHHQHYMVIMQNYLCTLFFFSSFHSFY